MTSTGTKSRAARAVGRAAAAWLAAACGAWAQEAAAPAATSLAPDLCQAVTEGVRLLEEHRLAPAADAARKALVEALIRAGEPSAVFLDEEGLAARSRRLSEREWDTGLTLVAVPDALPKVAAVRADSPAAAAGILPGEWIEKIAGRDVLAGANLTLVREALFEGDEAPLDVGVRGADEKSRVVSVERVRRTDTSLTDVEELPAGIGYARAAGIYPGAGAEIAAALETWRAAGIFGAILDLRGADGMAEEEIPRVALPFAKKDFGTLYESGARDGSEIQGVGPGGRADEAELRMPLMVLVDGDTTGAAELLAAVLAGSVKGAMIIGRETSGDPMIREPVPLPAGGYVLLAKRRIQTADGTVYAGANGVAPDVAITDAALDETVYEPEAPVLRKGKAPTDEEKEDKALRDRTRNDTYLRRAADVLLGLKALGYAGEP
ncbi:MAG: S41 family peptidase [Kiritimatiellia bacterium]